MKVLMITMKGSKERIEFQNKQFDSLKIEHKFFEAITPLQIPTDIPDAYWTKWERPLKVTERACFFSHLSLWQMIAECNEPVLVLEDDVVLSKSLPDFLVKISNHSGIDHLTLETRSRKKLISRKAHFQLEDVAIHKMYLDRSGAAAYILWPSGAKKLVAHADKGASLADAMICQSYNLHSYQTVPALAYQADCSEFYERPNPLLTSSTVSSHQKLSPLKDGFLNFLRYRCRRIRAQLGMLARIIIFFPFAKRLHLDPKSDF